MLRIGLLLLVIAAALLILAVRGRVVARGVFCRRCRFDLAGLDRTASGAACPECGKDLAEPRATGTVLRRMSRPGLLVAMVLMLLGVGLTAASSGNNSARIYAAIPDRIVLALHRLGVDAAFVEITTNRLTRTPPLSEEAWNVLIDEALDHLDDTATPWDIRQGEVISQALLKDYMDEPRLLRFVNAAITVEATLREEVRRGQSVPMRLRIVAPRTVVSKQSMYALGDEFQLTFSITDQGRVHTGHVPWAGGGGGAGFYLPSRPGDPAVGGLLSGIQLRSAAWEGVSAGETIRVFADVRMTLRRNADGVEWPLDPVRIERDVAVVPPDELIVEAESDPQQAAAISEAAISRRIRVRPSDLDQGAALLPLSVFLDLELPVSKAVAGRLFIREDGSDTEIASLVAAPDTSAVTWNRSVPREDGDGFKAFFERWIEQGSVDLVFRTDPEVAFRFPEIDSVVAVDLLFPGVPLFDVDDPRAQDDRTEVGAVLLSDVPDTADPSAAPTSPEP